MKNVRNTLLVIIALAASAASAQNLLLNGDFNSPNTGAWPDNWQGWSWGSGWANHENNVSVSYDGSYYVLGGGFNYDEGGGGFFQTVAATAGQTYQLSVLSGADAWWQPYGEMRIFFLDSGNNQLGAAFTQPTVNPPDYGYQNDIAHPWASYSMLATAPVGTTQVKVEFAEPHGTGSVWFENAMLTAIPEPGSLCMLAAGLGLLWANRRRTRRN